MPSRAGTGAVTLQDIADACGLAKSSVSRALRGQPGHDPETAAKVRAAAERLGYRPNPLVTSLMIGLRQRNRALRAAPIAVIDTWDQAGAGVRGRRFYRETVNTIEEHAVRSGFCTEIFSLRQVGGDWARLRSVLLARGIQGVVFLPFPRPGGVVPVDLSPFACATVGPSLHTPALHRSDVNHYGALRLAAAQVRARGYDRIGLALRRSADERAHGLWQAAFHVFQQSLPAAQRLPILWHDDSGAAQLGAWRRRCRPDAVLCVHREVAQWLAQAGVRFPDDIGLAFIGCDFDGERYSGIRRGTTEVARAAVDLVAGQLYRNERGTPARPQVMLVPPEWCEGRTLRPLPQ